MVRLIPRLVLDEDEVSKIIHDASDDDTVENRKNEENERGKKEDCDNKGENSESVGDQSSSSKPKQIPIHCYITDPKKLVEKLHRIILGLPEHLRTAPNVIKQATLKLPAHASELAGNIPSTLAELPATIITWTSSGQTIITTSITITANAIKDLPHRATFKWRHLLGVLTVMILCPLLGEIVFFLPMNPVDDGPEENQVFIYGIMTLYQFFMQLPWVETCNFAMSQVNIPIHARLVALFVGLAIAKLIDLILTTGIITYKPVFPIPFSILVTGTFGTLPTVPILYLMTDKVNRKRGNFGLMFALLIAYWVALLIVIGWAIGIQRLQGHPLQYLVLFSYAILRFVCKVLICANISTRLQPKRHIQLNLVVDVLFTRVQVATWPFIDSPFTLMALFASESSVILWRYYNGVDRIQLWWGAIMATASLEPKQQQHGTVLSKRRRLKGITEACFMASNQSIIKLSLSEDKEDVIRSLMTCKTSSSTVGDDSSIASSVTTIEKKQNNETLIIGPHSNNRGETVPRLSDICTAGMVQGRGRVLDSSPPATMMLYSGNDNFSCSYFSEGENNDDGDDEFGMRVGMYGLEGIIRCTRDAETSTTQGIICSGATNDKGMGGTESPVSYLFDDDDDDGDDDYGFGTNSGLSGIVRRPIVGDDTATASDTGASNDDKSINNNSNAYPTDTHPLASSSSPTTASSTETWEQRDLYHMVDSTGSLCVNIIVRINQQLIVVAVRNLPSSRHLNESFQIGNDRWWKAQIYGSIYVGLMLLLLIAINFSPVFFHKKKGLEGKKFSLGRVLSYLFKDHFWYFFFWLISTGALVSSAMVNHFGADFSMNFEYLRCLEAIEWPGCPSPD